MVLIERLTAIDFDYAPRLFSPPDNHDPIYLIPTSACSKTPPL
jgi:hypothetical protein